MTADPLCPNKTAAFFDQTSIGIVPRQPILAASQQQLNRAIDQIATLPATAELRRDEIRLQVALMNPLMPLKGHAAPETKAATDRAYLLIERAKELGEPRETRYCYSLSSTTFGARISLDSTVTLCALMLRSSWHLPKSRVRACR